MATHNLEYDAAVQDLWGVLAEDTTTGSSAAAASTATRSGTRVGGLSSGIPRDDNDTSRFPASGSAPFGNAPPLSRQQRLERNTQHVRDIEHKVMELVAELTDFSDLMRNLQDSVTTEQSSGATQSNTATTRSNRQNQQQHKQQQKQQKQKQSNKDVGEDHNGDAQHHRTDDDVNRNVHGDGDDDDDDDDESA